MAASSAPSWPCWPWRPVESYPRDRLIDGVWGDAATDTAVATLQVYVSMLRRVIPGGEHGASLVGRPPGYVLEVDPEHVDALRFERLVAEARKELADQRHEAAATGFQAALGRGAARRWPTWRRTDFAAPEVARLVELRTGAIEDRIQADLACGRHMTVVPELETPVLEHPFRERLWGYRTAALYRSGLQSEALGAFARARTTLVEEFGIDPGPELRELERQVLSQDPSLAAPHGAPRTTVKLPAPAHQMVGRSRRSPPCLRSSARAPAW